MLRMWMAETTRAGVERAPVDVISRASPDRSFGCGEDCLSPAKRCDGRPALPHVLDRRSFWNAGRSAAIDSNWDGDPSERLAGAVLWEQANSRPSRTKAPRDLTQTMMRVLAGIGS